MLSKVKLYKKKISFIMYDNDIEKNYSYRPRTTDA